MDLTSVSNFLFKRKNVIDKIDIARVPLGGRIFEMLGEDPFLTSQLGFTYINAVQSQGVIATAKHYINNDEEYLSYASSSVMAFYY